MKKQNGEASSLAPVPPEPPRRERDLGRGRGRAGAGSSQETAGAPLLFSRAGDQGAVAEPRAERAAAGLAAAETPAPQPAQWLQALLG